MTISTLTAFSGITEGAYATPEYLNSKFSQVVDNLTTLNSDATLFGLTTSGVTVSGATQRLWVLPSILSGGWAVDVRAHGAVGDGSNDDTSAIQSAISSAASSQINAVFFGHGVYRVTSTITLPANIQLWMFGTTGAGGDRTRIISQHSRDVFVVSGPLTEFHNVTIQASSASTGYSMGRGIFVTGGENTRDLRFLNCNLENFDGAFDTTSNLSGCLAFDNDSGANSLVLGGRYKPFSTSAGTEAPSISIGSDTDTRQRFITNVHTFGGRFSVLSGNNTAFQACNTRWVEIGPHAFATTVMGCRLASGSTRTVWGNLSLFIGNAVGSSVELASTLTGAWVGNTKSGLNFALINNTVPANCYVVDEDEWSLPSNKTLDLNQSRLLSIRTLAASALTVSAGNTNVAVDEMVFTVGGASGASLAIHSGGTIYIFNSALSARAT